MTIIHTTLDAEDLLRIVLLADRRNFGKQGRGIPSRRIDPKKTDFGIHLEGVMAEYVVARELGTDMNREVYLRGDDGIDLEYNYWRLQIKGYPYNGPNFRVYLNDMREFRSADVLVAVHILTFDQLDILGCIHRDKFPKVCKADNFGHGRRICVLPQDLDDLSVIREAMPQ